MIAFSPLSDARTIGERSIGVRLTQRRVNLRFDVKASVSDRSTGNICTLLIL